jgi:hypothetical protein
MPDPWIRHFSLYVYEGNPIIIVLILSARPASSCRLHR